MNSTALAFDVLAEYHLEGEVTEGKLFGYSCLEVDGKAFLVDFEDDLVFNLGREAKASWLADSEDRHGFDPSRKRSGDEGLAACVDCVRQGSRLIRTASGAQP